ncbi:hypothetical protein JW933_09545 [candidate division FCPU426 bacterium]|nr:hypothetical protein [candidate division FCPU426 bacterium]
MKPLRIAGLLFLLWQGLAGHALAQTNPFAGGEVTKAQKIIPGRVVNTWFRPIVLFSQRHQKVFRKKLAAFARQMKEKPYGRSLWLFLCFSFLYGIFHAIGPGHGKSIVAAYFLNRPGHLGHGFLMGNLLTFIHVLSAVAIILCLWFVLKVSGLTTFHALGGRIATLSAGLLTGVGVYLLWKSISEYWAWKQEDEFNGNTQRTDLKSLFLTSLVTGLVPCPGAALILSYAIINNVLVQGLLAMVAVAAGMGMTTSGIAFLVIVSRHTAVKVFSGQFRQFKLGYTMLSCIGAVLIMGVAVVMLVGSL